jgi:hypothetical protein
VVRKRKYPQIMGNIDLDVVKSANSWSEGIKRYSEQKKKPLFDVTPMPEMVTTYQKSREDAAVNPILQKFNDPAYEQRLQSLETNHLAKTLNRAWDKQLMREQHFDVITQIPKRGHIHEVPYVQRLKPPSLITATRNEGYDLLSTLGHDQHHWAPPDKRPPRISTPVKKQQMLTAVNKPRGYDIISNRFHEDHGPQSKWESENLRQTTVEKFWDNRDFNPITCSYYDAEKEEFYNSRLKELLLLQGSDAINRLPPTLAKSESLMYNICTGVVKDPIRLERKIEQERAALEAKAIRIRAEEMMRVRGDVRAAAAAERKDARVSHARYTSVTDRGFHILSNQSFDQAGDPPPPRTRPRMSLWEFKESLGSTAPAPAPPASGRGPRALAPPSSGGSSASAPSQREVVGQSPAAASLSKTRIRSGGF